MGEAKAFYDLLTPREIARFWRHVERRGEDECWPWVSERKPTKGYGIFKVWVGGRRRRLIASRVSLALKIGGDLGALQTRHQCHNPECVNPAHLLAGTGSDNAQDSIRDGRWRSHGRSTGRKPKSPDLRARAEQMSGSVMDISKALGVYHQLVRAWIKRRDRLRKVADGEGQG